MGVVDSIKNEPARLEEIPTCEFDTLVAAASEDTSPRHRFKGRVVRNVGWTSVDADTVTAHPALFRTE